LLRFFPANILLIFAGFLFLHKMIYFIFAENSGISVHARTYFTAVSTADKIHVNVGIITVPV
jgi:hypothetical protein